MEYLKLLSCSPVKNIHLTMVTSPHDNRCILAEDYLLWDRFFRIPSQECAYVSTVVELMEVKAIRYIVHYKLIFVFAHCCVSPGLLSATAITSKRNHTDN